MRHSGWLFGAVLLVQQTAVLRLAVPVEPVRAIVDALRSHDVVAMGAGHGEERGYALVRATPLGAADFTFYYGSEAMGRFAIRDGKADFSKHIPPDQWRTLRAEDQFDAVLYPGPEPPIMLRDSPERCADKADIDEHLRRIAIAGTPRLGDQLKQLCAIVTPK